MRGWNRRNLKHSLFDLGSRCQAKVSRQHYSRERPNPAFKALVTNSLYPASVATLPSGFGQAVNVIDQQYNSDQGDIKVDYNATEKDHVSFRYSKGDQYDPLNNSVALLGNMVNEAYLQSGAVSWNHTFSPNLLTKRASG